MAGIYALSKAAYLAHCSGLSSNRFSRANPCSSISSCKLWGNKLDSKVNLNFLRFSDESHQQFYSEIVRQKKNKKSKCRNTLLNASLKELVHLFDSSLEAAEDNGLNAGFENLDAIEPLVKQLKALQAEVKAKKRELKEKKKEMKTAMKEKKKSKCDSSSSSSESSESSENEVCMDKIKKHSKESVEMKAGVKQQQSKCDLSSSSSESSDNEEELCMNKIRVSSKNSEMIEPLYTSTIAPLDQIRNTLSQPIDCLSVPILEKEQINDDKYRSGSYLLGVKSSVVPEFVKTGGRVEVCTGGKCRRDGSQQVLSAFQEAISATSDVVISACKCMGKCGKGPNVRVHKDSESNPQVYTAVSEEDANVLFHYHFGVSPEQGILVCN